jgi:hypothetical protein
VPPFVLDVLKFAFPVLLFFVYRATARPDRLAAAGPGRGPRPAARRLGGEAGLR